MKRAIILACVAISLCVFASCSFTWFTRTVYVPAGSAVRLRQTVRNVDVWVRTDEGEILPGCLDLPEGWFVLADPGEEK